jgi:1-acyl-sn-glycerol-3-phosphate acyltransferase
LCGQHLADGGRIIIAFPEGGRGADDKLRPFKRGPAIVSMALQLPVMPTWIGGARNILPKGRLFPRQGTITVAFGDILQPPAPQRPTDRKLLSAAITQQLAQAVQALAHGHGDACGDGVTKKA